MVYEIHCMRSMETEENYERPTEAPAEANRKSLFPVSKAPHIP